MDVIHATPSHPHPRCQLTPEYLFGVEAFQMPHFGRKLANVMVTELPNQIRYIAVNYLAPP
jgi:hypothetical protein